MLEIREIWSCQFRISKVKGRTTEVIRVSKGKAFRVSHLGFLVRIWER